VATSLAFPVGLPLDTTSWEQTPLAVRQVVIHLLAVIQQPAVRIAQLEARVSQNSSNSDRPPSFDPAYAQRIARSGSEVQTWYARMVCLIGQYHLRRDEGGRFARTPDREMGALWTFVVEIGVEPTNNRAERALRFAVVWRRMMHGTYGAKRDRWVERILSVRETCHLRGRPTFPVLVEAVTCYFNGQPPNVSWI
jgi:hypothetical protein